MIDPVANIAAALKAEFRSLDYAKADFPMLTAWGVPDFSHTIHSLGCNYLCALGRHLGFWAISDYPVRVGCAGNGHSVRPDVVWWASGDTAPLLLGEFERFDPRAPSKLVTKARNLLKVHHTIGIRPRVLMLVGWALAGTDLGRDDAIRAIMHSGFTEPEGLDVPGLPADSVFIHATALFGVRGAEHRLLGIAA